jgi:hypothetical protein
MTAVIAIGTLTKTITATTAAAVVAVAVEAVEAATIHFLSWPTSFRRKKCWIYDSKTLGSQKKKPGKKALTAAVAVAVAAVAVAVAAAAVESNLLRTTMRDCPPDELLVQCCSPQSNPHSSQQPNISSSTI